MRVHDVRVCTYNGVYLFVRVCTYLYCTYLFALLCTILHARLSVHVHFFICLSIALP